MKPEPQHSHDHCCREPPETDLGRQLPPHSCLQQRQTLCSPAIPCPWAGTAALRGHPDTAAILKDAGSVSCPAETPRDQRADSVRGAMV